MFLEPYVSIAYRFSIKIDVMFHTYIMTLYVSVVAIITTCF